MNGFGCFIQSLASNSVQWSCHTPSAARITVDGASSGRLSERSMATAGVCYAERNAQASTCGIPANMGLPTNVSLNNPIVDHHFAYKLARTCHEMYRV